MPISWGRRGQLHADEGWLEERRHLFETYCLASVVAAERSCPSVTWVLLCAEDSPPSLKAFMLDVHERYPWIVPLYVEENPRMEDVVAEVCKRAAKKPCPFLLTTRLDSDDALSPQFIEDLHRVAKRSLDSEVAGRRQLPVLINFPIGLQAVGERLYLSSDWGNPFLSLLEEQSNDRTIIGCYPDPHREVHKWARTVRQHIASGPSWLQVLHGNNEATVVCGLRVPLSIGIKRFGFLRTERRHPSRTNAFTEAMRGIREQLIQSADYGWKRIVFRSQSIRNQSGGHRT